MWRLNSPFLVGVGVCIFRIQIPDPARKRRDLPLGASRWGCSSFDSGPLPDGHAVGDDHHTAAVSGGRIEIKIPNGDIRGHRCPCFTADASCGPLKGSGSAGECADVRASWFPHKLSGPPRAPPWRKWERHPEPVKQQGAVFGVRHRCVYTCGQGCECAAGGISTLGQQHRPRRRVEVCEKRFERALVQDRACGPCKFPPDPPGKALDPPIYLIRPYTRVLS